MKIGQAKARFYKKRVEELETVLRNQKSRWSTDFQRGWINIEALILPDASFAKIEVARKLGHAVIVVPGNRANEISFYAESLK